MTAADTIMGEHLERAHVRAPRSHSKRADVLSWGGFAVLVAAVWRISQTDLYEARSDVGYWMGVVGGVLMLLLFAYPLRKRWRALATMGKAKTWFIVHMVLGIGGPLTILAHSKFQIGSLNAGVALGSMLIVALSGIAGRFIYIRIHRGLGGERLSLDKLRDALGFSGNSVHSQLAFAPQADARLRALERHAGEPADSWGEHLRRLAVLPLQVRRERRASQLQTDTALVQLAHDQGWNAAKLSTRQRRARRLIRSYCNAVLKVAQFSAYVRLFSLWHVLHVPFVVLMVLCAIVHIVAVHSY